ncbi:terpene synthase family protein [Chitinophaga japonensis]|uniref:Terpene synthase n=1 Tax=Chitinophaga japonensis TaxID=104662 RepID=A0A562T101_CHIJA|nr:hypothetical protein [Chitinophaga japonensis]TWI86918.1 terpene synthase family protein [Chitinophaga japonensis]
MQTIQFPRMQYPFPSLMNRFANLANEQNLLWAQTFGLLKTEEALARFRKAKFALLVSRTFPNAGYEELCILCNFNSWLFLHDDQCDEAQMGRQATNLQQVTDYFTEILTREIAEPEQGGAFALALADIWQRLLPLSRPAWRQRFIRSMQEYFKACLWEAGNRAEQRAPSVADYVIMRPYTGALFVDLEFVEISEKVHLPDQVLQHAMVQRLALACNNIVCWTNDIMSCRKEAGQGDVHNLVLALMRERSLSMQDAINETVRMHDEEVRLFAALEKLLPSFDAETDQELTRYVAVLRSWITGNYDWSVLDTGRYRVDPAPETHVQA